MKSDIVCGIFVGICISLIIAGIIRLSTARDRELFYVMEEYETCVQREYGMTPLQYKNFTREMPECDFNSN